MSELLDMTLREIKDNFYGIGDGSHSYAFGYITKELGDKLIDKYGDDVRDDGCRIEPLTEFDLSSLPSQWDLEDVYKESLQYLEFYGEGNEGYFLPYKSFEEFKKGEGFE